MKTLRKCTILGGVGGLVALMAPVVWSAFSAHSYFDSGRCLCGHDSFVRIVGDGYFSYSPGHGVPELQQFKIRRTTEGWEVPGLPHSDKYWSPLEGEDRVIAYLQLRSDGLYDSWD